MLASIDDAIPWPIQADSTREDLISLTDSPESKLSLISSLSFRKLEELPSSNSGVEFSSSTANITAVNNVLLTSVPNLTTQLQDVLNAAKPQSSNLQGITDFYQCNHTGWSFEVAFVEDKSVHYATLSAIVTRILYHLPDAAQFNVTKTRVGVIKRGSVAIANIGTLPLVPQAAISSDAVPVVGADETLDMTNATAWEMALGSDDVMLTTLRVNAVTTSKQPFDPLILDYFNATVPSADDLSKAASAKRDDVAIGPERMLFYEINRDMLYITISVYENPNEDTAVRNSSITEFPSLLLSVGTAERAIEDLSDLQTEFTKNIKINHPMVDYNTEFGPEDRILA